MFDDIIKTDKTKKLYICQYTEQCDSNMCLHKHPHEKCELGRPEDSNVNSDCSLANCKSSIFENAVCVPVPRN